MKVKAIIYDFDGTLTPETLPRFEILEKSGVVGGFESPEFRVCFEKIAKKRGLHTYEAMIMAILQTVKEAGFETDDKNIGLGAENRQFNLGVPEFVEWAKAHGVANYILSAGAKAYLDQLKIAPLFDRIYATTLNYDTNGEAISVKKLMTDEQKVETLRDIARQMNGDSEDCEGMVYFGDGMTDVPAFEFVKQHGGKTVLICKNLEDESLGIFRKQKLIDLYALNDYRKDSAIYNYIKALL